MLADYRSRHSLSRHDTSVSDRRLVIAWQEVFSLSDRHSTDLSHRNTAQHPIYLYPTAIGRGLGQEVCNVLCHAFSGCSCTSAFTGRCKVSRFKLIKEDESFRSTMSSIGHDKKCCCRKNGGHGISKCMSGNCSNSKETGTDQFDPDDDSGDEWCVELELLTRCWNWIRQT